MQPRRSAVHHLVFAFLVLAGCEALVSDLGDGGTGVDAGRSVDAGIRDGSVDDAGAFDAGRSIDAGSTVDGGSSLDGGYPSDGGAHRDAGVRDAGPLEVQAFADLPALSGGEGGEWANAEPRLVKDNVGGEWLLMRQSAGGQTSFDVSADGRTWHSVSRQTNAACVGDCTLPLRVMSMVQDAAGTVHLLVGANDYSGPLREYYGRVTLGRTGSGAVSSYRLDALVALPAHARSANILTDLRGELQLMRVDGQEALLYVLSLTTVSSNYTGDIKVFVGRAKSLAPMSASDFVRLDGTAGDSLVFDSCSLGAPYCTVSPAFLSTHNQTAQLAQIASTGDLYLFVGPIEADYGFANDPAGQPEASRLRVKRLPWSAGTHTWSTSAPFVQLADTDGSYLPLLLDAASSDDAVWLMWLSPTDGVRLTRFDAQGNPQQLPSPLNVRHYSGWGVLNVAADGTTAWAIWNLCTSDNTTPGLDCTDPKTAQARWAPSGWTVVDDVVATGDNSGLVGATGWVDGAAAVLFRGTLLRNAPPVPQFASVH